MNSGANIVKLGATDLRRTFGDSIMTSQANRSELSRRYFIHKHLMQLGRDLLIRGYKAPEYSNMYLMEPPRQSIDAAHIYFDCMFSGILDIAEGGNGPLYERVERNSNIGTISDTTTYTQTVLRYFYTIKYDADDRSATRIIPLPTTVTARTTSGTTVIYDGSLFFWELYDKPRTNFDLYDEVIESWRLTYKTT